MDDLRTLALTLANEMFARYGEPMPAFDDPRNELHKLDAALFSPQQSFAGQELYPRFEEKAAVLFYGIVKAHALHNGNKRIACTALIVFLAINGYEFTCPPEQLEATVIRVAESSSTDNKAVQNDLVTWLGQCIRRAA
ncbi:type II toxin-antitoxin system death-on-curing family toxin [Candidatus Uhrbacteria bacterium]|nr:type II toxin-antitoxin system death-on-curing family toxin [Candidatus Uhrbacteria bacterium]